MSKYEKYSRNHFIPEYFLKYFTNKDNHFFVYNKLTDEFSRKSPSQVCFEWNRNTLHDNDQNRHTLLEEKTYRYFDDKHSKTFSLLNSTDFRKSPWNLETVGNLELFIPLLFWRSPISDIELHELLDRTKFTDELGLIISQRGKIFHHTGLHRQFLDDLNVRKAIRPSLIYNTFGKSHEYYDKLEWRVIQRNSEYSNILSDNPIIFQNKPQSFVDFRGPVIMPLSKERSLVRVNENCEDNYHNQLMQDIAITHQAIKFVICPSKDYLTAIISHYHKLDQSEVTQNYQRAIFKKYESN